jgi:hypothetical protein
MKNRLKSLKPCASRRRTILDAGLYHRGRGSSRSRFQHAAIIARQHDLPCAGAIHGVTGLIYASKLINMDGSSGLVKFLRRNSGKSI